MKDNLIINNIINIDGINKYAYVVMIVHNELYANPGIVFAESIRKIGCLGDLVVMVDKNISDETKNLLKKFYNKIVLINNININIDDPLKKIILLKINAFLLEEYEKIFLIDVDTILFTNIDNIFLSKNAPAISVIENNKNFGFILLEPSKKLFNKSLEIINKYEKKLNNEQKPFNFIINKMFKKIDKLDINLSADKYENTDGIQYINNKPFLMSSNLTIEDRMRLNHFKIWFYYFSNIMIKYPEIKKNKILKETIDVSRYFLAPISRFIVNYLKINKNKKQNQIVQIYGQKKYKKLDYYHLNNSREYFNDNIIYDNNLLEINFFLKYLTDMTNINFNKLGGNNSTKEIINKIGNIFNVEIFLNQYIKIFPNVFVIIELNKASDSFESDFDQFDNKSIFLKNQDLKNNLIYLKKIKINGLVLKNILFNIIQNYTYSQRLLFLSSISNELLYEVEISICETLGQIDFNDMDTNNNNLFVLFDKKSKIRLSSIFFNPNTIEMFNNNNQLCNHIDIKNNLDILNRRSLINLIYFQTLKKWIHSIYSVYELNNIIINLFDNKYKLIDNNEQNIISIKKINENKIFFVEIIFLKSSQYKNSINNFKKITNTIYDPNEYWELEGIKFTKESL